MCNRWVDNAQDRLPKPITTKQYIALFFSFLAAMFMAISVSINQWASVVVKFESYAPDASPTVWFKSEIQSGYGLHGVEVSATFFNPNNTIIGLLPNVGKSVSVNLADGASTLVWEPGPDMSFCLSLDEICLETYEYSSCVNGSIVTECNATEALTMNGTTVTLCNFTVINDLMQLPGTPMCGRIDIIGGEERDCRFLPRVSRDAIPEINPAAFWTTLELERFIEMEEGAPTQVCQSEPLFLRGMDILLQAQVPLDAATGVQGLLFFYHILSVIGCVEQYFWLNILGVAVALSLGTMGVNRWQEWEVLYIKPFVDIENPVLPNSEVSLGQGASFALFVTGLVLLCGAPWTVQLWPCDPKPHEVAADDEEETARRKKKSNPLWERAIRDTPIYDNEEEVDERTGRRMKRLM